MDAEPDTRDRAAGCLLGLALGDAVGAPFAGRRRRDISASLAAGTTTRVTTRAMHLAWSLVDRGGFDPDDLTTRLLDWAASGAPGLDGLTASVLRRVAPHVSPTERLAEIATRAAAAEWERRGPEVSAGNAPVASCAPLGCAYANRPSALPEAASVLTGLTHHDARCVTAVTAVASTVGSLVRGDAPESAVVAALNLAADEPGGEELEFLANAVGRSRSVDGPDRGFVLYAAAVGLQTVVLEESFLGGVRRVVAMGGDTASNAAVAGALLGGRVGVAALPPDWLDMLDGRGEIGHVAALLAVLASTG